MANIRASLVVGVFVGGQGSRMGGVAKGLLRAPGSRLSLVEQAVQEIRAALPDAEVVLVGSADAYAGLGLVAIGDQPPGIGPLGGLLGLLGYANGRASSAALAVACDLPYLNREIIARLASEAPQAVVVVAHQGEIKNPLLARYATDTALRAAQQVHAAGQRSLQAVLARLAPGVASLALSAAEQSLLQDWDTPEDVRKSR